MCSCAVKGRLSFFQRSSILTTSGSMGGSASLVLLCRPHRSKANVAPSVLLGAFLVGAFLTAALALARSRSPAATATWWARAVGATAAGARPSPGSELAFGCGSGRCGRAAVAGDCCGSAWAGRDCAGLFWWWWWLWLWLWLRFAAWHSITWIKVETSAIQAPRRSTMASSFSFRPASRVSAAPSLVPLTTAPVPVASLKIRARCSWCSTSEIRPSRAASRRNRSRSIFTSITVGSCSRARADRVVCGAGQEPTNKFCLVFMTE